jgi:hypothetical protein
VRSSEGYESSWGQIFHFVSGGNARAAAEAKKIEALTYQVPGQQLRINDRQLLDAAYDGYWP